MDLREGTHSQVGPFWKAALDAHLRPIRVSNHLVVGDPTCDRDCLPPLIKSRVNVLMAPQSRRGTLDQITDRPALSRSDGVFRFSRAKAGTRAESASANSNTKSIVLVPLPWWARCARVVGTAPYGQEYPKTKLPVQRHIFGTRTRSRDPVETPNSR